MEPSESDSSAVSNSNGHEGPQLGLHASPSPPSAPNPQPSDLNHTVEEDALGGELESKLDLKGEEERGVETGDKVSDFNPGGGICDEGNVKGEVHHGENVNGEGSDEVNVKGEGHDEENMKGEGYDGENMKGEGHDEENVRGEGYYEENVRGEGYDEENVRGEGYDGENVRGEEGDVDSRGWETNSWNEDVGVDGNGYGDGDGDVVGNKEEGNGARTHSYPLRPEAEDCSFYMKTGNCKFGFNCKFNHPIRRKNQAIKEKTGDKEEPAEKSQTECKYYQRSGGCKFGKSCKYNHPRGKTSTPAVLELNFLGLPLRPGERECPYYMRTGSCKFGANCKFNHPDPTAVGGCDPPSGYGNGGSISLKGVSPLPSVSSWSSPGKINETSYVPMMIPPTQGVSPRSPDWNGYQAPVYLSERSMHPPSTFVMNNPAIETNAYMHHQKQVPVEEFPERPGEPECSYFLKTGDCKYKSNCKFHHPKNRIARLPPCNLSDKGLPLRPDQSVCSHYSRYGICKFGPACKFDHPIGSQPLMMPGLGQPFSNSASVEVAGIGGSAGASDSTVQQSV